MIDFTQILLSPWNYHCIDDIAEDMTARERLILNEDLLPIDDFLVEWAIRNNILLYNKGR